VEQYRIKQRSKNSHKKLWIVLTIVFLLVVALGIAVFMYIDRKDSSQPKQIGSPKTSQETDDQTPSKGGTTTEDPKVETPKTEPHEKPDDSGSTPDKVSGYPKHPLPTEVTKPSYVKGVLIANKQHPLPPTYTPGENKKARAAFEEMAAAAEKDGIKLIAFSTYRSYNYQVNLYQKYVDKEGQAAADRYSARPGYSEHQTGLGFDIGEVGQEQYWANEKFANTPGADWLSKHGAEYGFILRYPKNKESVTNYEYEAWHFRYLGKELATKIDEGGLTLEEYLSN
jgi:D-alanyl-D-alanine carboxypeptidase